MRRQIHFKVSMIWFRLGNKEGELARQLSAGTVSFLSSPSFSPPWVLHYWQKGHQNLCVEEEKIKAGFAILNSVSYTAHKTIFFRRE